MYTGTYCTCLSSISPSIISPSLPLSLSLSLLPVYSNIPVDVCALVHIHPSICLSLRTYVYMTHELRVRASANPRAPRRWACTPTSGSARRSTSGGTRTARCAVARAVAVASSHGLCVLRSISVLVLRFWISEGLEPATRAPFGPNRSSAHSLAAPKSSFRGVRSKSEHLCVYIYICICIYVYINY